ncbi:hypothetical protein AVEN_232361-1 [Araneus ventricosus]|uniref:Uncharacterized protein n=1 Tax=Araneus ventricosus TaxID=182803 RepID=A0A4Y2PE89_ARAVE|nr:hypothetical protein AVEN_232361-1 [Araneus ventricosus]
MNADRHTDRLPVDGFCPKFARNLLQIMCQDHIPNFIPVALIVFELSCSQTDRQKAAHGPCLMPLRQLNRLNGHGTRQTDRHYSKTVFCTQGGLKCGESSKSRVRFFDDYNTFFLYTRK